MVVFSCDGCGDVLKKNQVDAHAGRCRSCVSVSCADCGVHFFGDDYRTHTTCITEAERYEKSLYRSPHSSMGKKQKRNPQQEWMDLIALAATTTTSASNSSVAQTVSPMMQQQLKTLQSFPNVPRKEKQFRNFAINSLNLRSKPQMDALNQVWMHLNALRNAQKDGNVDASKERVELDNNNGNHDKKDTEQVIDHVSSNNKTHKPIPPTEVSEGVKSSQPLALNQSPIVKDHSVALPPSKQVFKAIKTILKQETTKCIKVKSLRSKLRDSLGLDKSMKGLLKNWIENNLTANAKVKVDGKMVRLL